LDGDRDVKGILVKTAALVVAAGRGQRAGGQQPKQYYRLAGETVLARAMAPFLSHSGIDAVAVVINPDDADLYRGSIPLGSRKLLEPVGGGATRQSSVLAGLAHLAELQPDRVLIHDAARPFVSAEIIDRVLVALETQQGAIAAAPLTDTLKRANADGTIAGTVDREGLWRAQTPQGFHFAAILSAHRQAAAQGRNDFTDDAALAEWAGIPVALVPGGNENVKITTADDLAAAATRLAATQRLESRTGTGFDVHRFAPGDHVWLCGVKIPHVARLDGHSDADVGLHALTDAILGALGEGDIGAHFPPSDPKWAGAASRLFLEDAARRVSLRQGSISNVDITLLCEAPKIGPHRDAMRASVASILGIDVSRVGVKATTTEGLGFTGRREGIAAMATATLLLPA
jgi:2-C-methyl-D-erythritol 4-phosphate cytidylyltransferase/2-C-methyl-D-erythritol 2,4-cyclodiphosphate synthase